MSENNSTTAATANSFLGALDRVRPEFARLSEQELLSITLDPVTAAVTMRGALPKIQALRPELEKLSNFDIRVLDKLEDYLHAWLRANALFLGSALPPEGFSSLVAKVAAFRDAFASDAQALVHRGVLGPETIAGLKGAVGHKNIAGDVLTLTTVFRSNWEKVSGRTCVTAAELDEADAALDELITDLGLRDQTPQSKEVTALERQQAYTLFVNAYDQIRRAVSFLRWSEGDADELAPSLFGGKKRKAVAESEPETSTPTGSSANPVVVSTTPDAASGVAPTVKTGIGLPGSDPFTN